MGVSNEWKEGEFKFGGRWGLKMLLSLTEVGSAANSSSERMGVSHWGLLSGDVGSTDGSNRKRAPLTSS